MPEARPGGGGRFPLLPMKKIFALLLICSLMALSPHKPAYQLYGRQGQPASYPDMLEALAQADVVLFGELHNNPICHWLQLEAAQDLHAAKGAMLTLGAEMFESDAQLVLSEYVQGLIKESHLTSEGKVWSNYATDYAPLVELAKAKNLPFIATNIPRRYANLVARAGLPALDSLPAAAKALIAPLPIEVDLSLPGYQNMMGMMGPHAGPKAEQFVQAQAVKDATMAHFILQHWQPEQTFLHFNGTYHSNRFEGIYWYLKRARPDLRIVTIGSVEQEGDIQTLAPEHQGLADFILCVPANMTKTH
jgi:uncharacterized iron-regulated protein